MKFLELINLKQNELYGRTRKALLPDLRKRANEHELTRLVEEKVKSDGRSLEYVRIMAWLVGYCDFKDTKEHHKASRTRHENAVEIADWFVDSWYEDESERANMQLGLALASPDIRLRAALVLYELGGLPGDKRLDS